MGGGTPAVETMTMRMWFSNLHAGTMIGKGGMNIKAIREESACRVMIAEAAMPGGERLVTIVGPPLSVNRACELMLDRIEAAQVGEANAFGAVAGTMNSSHILKLCLTNNQVGAIIGKAGAVIKSLREESGANIKVETPTNTVSPERLVTISGGKAECVRAHQLAALKLATVPEDAPPNHPSKYQRTMPSGGGMPGRTAAPYYGAPPQPGYSALPPPASGGYAYSQPAPYGQPALPPQQQHMGMPSMGSPQMGSSQGYYAPPPAAYGGAPHCGAPPPGAYGAPLASQQAPYQQSCGGRPVTQGPPPSYGSSAACAQPPGYATSAATYSHAGYAFAGSAYTNGYGGGACTSAPASSWSGTVPTPTGGPDGEMMQLIPSIMAGRLIGKGGSGIRELREVSRATVRIGDSEPGTEQRKVTVSGPPEAVQMALSMIAAKLAQGP